MAEQKPTTSDGYLRGDFADSNSIGPRRVAQFMHKGLDANTQADAVGVVRELLSALDQGEAMP